MYGRCYLDFETRSSCDLNACGAAVYARHPSTTILCGDVKKNGKSLTVFDFARDRSKFLDFIGDSPIVAHNVTFEREIWENILVKRYGYPSIPIERFHCTLAKCSQYSLPRGLANAAYALNLLVRKDMEGYKLMRLMSNAKNPYEEVCTTANLLRLGQYCAIDNDTAEGLDDAVPDLCEYERQVWLMDQEINSGGVRVDVALVKRLREIMTCEKAAAVKEATKLFADVPLLESPTQVAKFKKWVEDECPGVEVRDVSAGTITKLLRLDLPEHVKIGLRLRQKMSKTSTGKLEKLLNFSGIDEIARNILLYFGAHTGRWAGMDIQPQNFPSRMPKGWSHDTIIGLLDTIDDAEDLWPVNYGDCATPVKFLLRSCLIAELPSEQTIANREEYI